ncbi:hypothetical protein NBO_284g0002 [Nosema bombycis CQ1]|uniref:Uncharacterized protein n=1 Tax=Nosema bombycis (strain CQ1 / CVCC 102059) TaxID=578461 RepID=R0M4R1_NOSB1|nr:hypothetical protein NBO_284g0002 [Nosema bombycis CQ1]|eukprot:EOB12974.1 hypothetical protein NBO_284g0002 [Nosema bombycis CQ1]
MNLLNINVVVILKRFFYNFYFTHCLFFLLSPFFNGQSLKQRSQTKTTQTKTKTFKRTSLR